MTKPKNRKIKIEAVIKEDVEPEAPPLSRSSDEPPPKKDRWTNKQRVLVVASRGIRFAHRHLMQDLRSLMPHCRPENKIDRKENLSFVNEICAMQNCNKAVLFEARHHEDLYMWFSNINNGPSAKFLVENVYTMAEMKLVGNCLKASRPLLSFDSNFEKFQHYAMLKEMFIQIFGVPNHHPKSQPFIDHIYSFSVLDNRIWFRNYQILSEDGALTEIGPRFVLNPIKIFNGSFGGETLWTNSHYVTPAVHRRELLKQAKAHKYVDKLSSRVHNELKGQKPADESAFDDDQEMYQGDPLEKAQEIIKHQKKLTSQTQGGSNQSPKLTKKKELKAREKFQVSTKQSNGTDNRTTVNGQPKLKKKLQGKPADSTQKMVAKKKALKAKIEAKRKQKTAVSTGY